MEKITILLIDDHQLIRESLAFVLNSDPQLEVIADTSDAEEAIEIVKTCRPQIVLVDINMSPANGFEVAREILSLAPDTRLIGMSVHNMPAYVRRMIQLGAKGYITKNSSREEMLKAVKKVYSGDKYLCTEVLGILARQGSEVSKSCPDVNVLSRREIDVVLLIRQGLSPREIASQLDISLKTVGAHRYNILKKLNLRNTAALVNFTNVFGLGN